MSLDKYKIILILLGLLTISSIVIYFYTYNIAYIFLGLISILGIIYSIYQQLFENNELKISTLSENTEFVYNSELKNHIIRYSVEQGKGIFKNYFKDKLIHSCSFNTEFEMKIKKEGSYINLIENEDWCIKKIEDVCKIYIKKSNTLIKEFKLNSTFTIELKLYIPTAKNTIEENLDLKEHTPVINENEKIYCLEIENKSEIPIYNYELFYELQNIENFNIIKIEHKVNNRATSSVQPTILDNHSILIEIPYSQIIKIKPSIYEQYSYQLKSTLDLNPGKTSLTFKIKNT